MKTAAFQFPDIALPASGPAGDEGDGDFLSLVFPPGASHFGRLVVLAGKAQPFLKGSTGIASAWILRHPANMQLIAGTMKTSRLKEICEASEIVLTREEWYRIYLAGGHILP